MLWAPFSEFFVGDVVGDLVYLTALLISAFCIRPLVRREFETLVPRLLLMWAAFMAAFAIRFSLRWTLMLMDIVDRLHGLAGAWLHTLLVPTALSLVGGIAVQVVRLRRPPRLGPIISLIAFGFCLVVHVFMVYGVLQLRYGDGFNVLDPSTFLVP